MTILRDDVKLVASRVMDDVPEGGGAPTNVEIRDGVSNEIFPDISEFDRAAGRVSLRKIFTTIGTADRDTFLGTNIIVARPPADPNVSVTIFDTADTFDERSDAKSRLEAYLFVGTSYPAFLFGNHITGQRTVLFFQRTSELPEIGSTLVLRKRDGFSDQQEQYIRVTSASATLRTFTDADGDFTRYIVTVGISDALRVDFPGFDVSRIDPSSSSLAAKTGVRSVIVADAARYYGCVPLTQAVTLGAYSAKASSIYTRLLPSAQTETAIADARTNQTSAAVVAAGATVTQTFGNAVFSPTQNLFVGAGITPGSFSITGAFNGVKLTDVGGALVDSSQTQVGSIDYVNGTLSLTTAVYPTVGDNYTVVYTPGAQTASVEQSVGMPITQSNRSLSYVLTIEPVPARGSLQASYRAGGRWYVLTEDGTGAIRGVASSMGAGTLNFTTGTMSLTLGALPDVGSSLILQWSDTVVSKTSTVLDLDNDGKVYFQIDASGKVFTPGTVSVSWGTVTVTDDGQGNLSGTGGTGTVNYTTGRVRVSPSALPASGTAALLNLGGVASATTLSVGSFTSSGSNWTFPTASNLRPGTLAITVYTKQYRSYNAGSGTPVVDSGFFERSISVQDNGAGSLLTNFDTTSVVIGSVDYTTGTVTLQKSLTGPISHTEVVQLVGFPWSYAKQSESSISVDIISRAASPDAEVSYTLASGGSSQAISSAIDNLYASVKLANAFTISGVRFSFTGKDMVVKASGSVQRDLSRTTGVGTEVGNLSASTGILTFTSWTTGGSPEITNWRGLQSPPVTGPYSPLQTGSVTFRTATAPLRPSSFSVLGTMTDGTTFNVAADANGKINSSRVKGRVNYEYGVVELYFCNTSAASGAPQIDLSFLGISGVGLVYADMATKETLRYNAVAYTYLPLDADLIGVDPVRLPSDGRVPIFRPGGFAVIGNTKNTPAATVANGQTINCSRVRLSRVRVVGANGLTIDSGYTADLEAGTVTFTNVSGYSQPVYVEHRIEDLLTIRDAQLDGQLDFTRPITHDYPVLDSYISSAMPAGDLHSRVSLTFDQQTWTGVWSDILIGSTADASYDTTLAPIVVTNLGALTERWYLRFTSTTAFQIIGEHVGVIGTGSVNTTCAPLNPRTNTPYFTVSTTGWGTGWAVGNILRFNTIGAEKPIWVCRTVQQGPETVIDDSFTLLVRGDVNRP